MRGHLLPFRRHINWWLALALCGLILVTRGKGSSPSCPPKGYDIAEISPCKCRLSREDYLQIWCSGSDLEGLTRGLASVATWRGSSPVDELVVEGGAVSGLPGRAFAPLRVRRLLMHRSGLERVSGAAFLELESSLVELMLVEPRLRSLPADLLDTLPLLEALTIDATDSGDGGNSVDGDAFPGRPVSVPLLRSLPSLRYLRISAPQTSGLRGVFPPKGPSAVALPALLSLSVHGGWAHARASEDGDDGLWAFLSFVAGCCGGLEELSIAGNGLRLGKRLASNSASPRGEVSLRSLRVLDMSDNPLGLARAADGGGTGEAETPPQTQWLLDGAPAWVFPSLAELRADRASLAVLPEGALRSVARLERLSLEGNSMRSIGPDALSDLPALHELRLRDNLLSEESMPPPPHRRRLPWTLPTLKGLDLSKNILRGGTALRRLLSGVPSVRRLDLSDNAIGTIADDAFAATPLLEFVDLSGNPLLSLPSPHLPPRHLSFLRPLSRLYELRISGNSPEVASGSLPVEPRRLDRSGGNGSFPALPPLPGVEVLVASDMAIGTLYRSVSSSPPPFSAALLPRLTLLDLSGNSLSALEPGAFSGVSQTLSGMDLSRNRLSGVLRLGPPLPMRSLRRLDVSDNRLEAISVVSSASPPELKVLNASGNGIPSLEMGMPSVLGSSLEVVDLSRNAMVALPEGPLKPFEMLTELWLDANDICSISGHPFDATPRLRVLSLRHNRLATLSPAPFRRLLAHPTAYHSPAASATSSQSRTLLRLEGNPLSCSCRLLWLQEWLQEVEGADEDEGRGLKCKDGTPLRDMRLTRRDCQRQLATSALISSGGDASVVEELDNRNGDNSCQESEESKGQASLPQELSARPVSSAQQQQHPLPEESEYFYDQYVDEIHPPTPIGNSGSNILEDTRTESVEYSTPPATTAESAVNVTTAGETSHDYISGDTPTIYASTRPKNESSSGNKDGGSGNSGAISIFGIPIPSWSLSGLFGSGKKRAGGTAKVARVNNPTRNPAAGQGRRRGNSKVMADRSPVNSPKLESGFRPIFPGSGGFVPINGKLGPPSSANPFRGQTTVPLGVKPAEASEPTPSLSTSTAMFGESVVHKDLSGDSSSSMGSGEFKTQQTFISNSEKTTDMTSTVEMRRNSSQDKYNRHGTVRDKYVTTTEPTDFVGSFVSVSENGRRFQSKWGGSRVIGTVERVELKKNVGVEVGSFDRDLKNSVGKAIMVSGESETNESINVESGRTISDGVAFLKNMPEIVTVKGELNEEIGRTKMRTLNSSHSYLSTTEVILVPQLNQSDVIPVIVPSTSTQMMIQSSATLPMNETYNVLTEDVTTSTAWTSTTETLEFSGKTDRKETSMINASMSQLPLKESTTKPQTTQTGSKGTPLSSYLLAPGGQARVTKVSKTSTSQRRHQYSSQFDGEYFPQANIHSSADIEFDDVELHKQDRTKSGIGFTKWPSNEQTKRSRLPEWYYANYNTTEKDVYKGPIEDIIVTEGYPGFPSSTASSSLLQLHICKLTLLVVINFSELLNPD